MSEGVHVGHLVYHEAGFAGLIIGAVAAVATFYTELVIQYGDECDSGLGVSTVSGKTAVTCGSHVLDTFRLDAFLPWMLIAFAIVGIVGGALVNEYVKERKKPKA